MLNPIKESQQVYSGHSKMDSFYFMDHLLMMRMREIIFEFIRRSHFPDRPSRLQSLFCFATYQDAVNFKTIYGDFNAKTFEVEAINEGFKADMKSLTITESFLKVIQAAEIYWSGEKNTINESPTYEILVGFPVKVGQRVN